MRHRKGGGSKPRLKSEQVEQLPTVLSRGAEASGFGGDVWTRARVAQVITQQFGVQCSLSPVGRLLGQIGWSHQKPIERATQRNEQAIERWRTATWQELQKKPNVKDEP